MQLTTEQQGVIGSILPSVAVVASPGSGKTMTVAKSVKELLNDYDKEQFLVSSFSVRDTHDLEDKIKDELDGRPLPSDMVVTNHSFCNGVIAHAAHDGLEEAARYLEKPKGNKLRICQGKLKGAFLREAIDKVAPEADDIDLSIVSSEIELWKAKCIKADMIEDDRRRRIYHEYEIIKRAKRYLDFTDLLLLAAKLFEQSKELVKNYQGRLKCILLDEMQDTNPAWMQVLYHLMPMAERVRVVGDFDQSIYSFRGSISDFVKPLKQIRSDTSVLGLTINFRSRDEIISHANQFMGVDMKGVKGGGGKIEYLGHFGSPEMEAFMVTDAIQEHLDKGVEPQDIAVISRVGYGLRAMSVILEKTGIPFKLTGAKPFFRQPDIMDMMAYVKCSMPDTLTMRPWKFHPFMRIINSPRRGLGKGFRDIFWQYDGTIWERLQKGYPEVYTSGLKSLTATINKVREMSSAYNIIKYIWTFGMYSDYHEKYIDKTGDDMEQLFELSSKFADIPTLIDYERSSLKKADEDNAIRLMTIHGSKGTEAEIVFATHVNHNIIPHYRGLPDEEKRLFYVLCTRAKSKLYFSSCNVSEEGNKKSKFVVIR